jgi:hypothetical protein
VPCIFELTGEEGITLYTADFWVGVFCYIKPRNFGLSTFFLFIAYLEVFLSAA